MHNAIYSATEHCLYVFPISGNFFLRLPIESDDYDVLCESPYHVLCSTNSLNQNKIYYTSWNIHDSSQRNSTYDSIPLRVCQYDINTKEFFTIKTIWGPDTIHQTYHCSASSSLLCVEMPIFTQVPINAKDPSPEDLKKVVQGGVCPSRLIYIKLREPDIIESFVDKGPAHITPASSEADTVFVSCCNMSAASCFGPGRIDKYSLRSKPVHLASYEAGDLFRIPSVSSFQLNGESLLCAAVFPNQVHIINADTMRLKDKIILSDTLSVPDFSRGPYRYPNYDKTPYTVLPISESPYIALCNIWSVRILDIRTGFIMEKLNFNKDRDPLITTGHSIMIDSYNG